MKRVKYRAIKNFPETAFLSNFLHLLKPEFTILTSLMLNEDLWYGLLELT